MLQFSYLRCWLARLFYAQSDIPSAFGDSSSAAKQTLIKMSQSNWKCIEQVDLRPDTLEKQGSLVVQTTHFMQHPLRYPNVSYSPSDASMQLNKPMDNGPTAELNIRVIAVVDGGFILAEGNWDTKQTIYHCRFQ